MKLPVNNPLRQRRGFSCTIVFLFLLSKTIIQPDSHEFPSCGGGGPAHAGGEGYPFSKTIIKPQAQKIKPAVHFCEISVGKVQGKNLGVHAIANVFSDKYAFTK